MLICALAVVPIVFASSVHNLWLAASLIGLAAAAHQGWSCNLFTLTSDMFPRSAVGAVVGFGGMTGAIGGMLVSKVVGYVLEATNSNYLIVFGIAGCMYLVALGDHPSAVAEARTGGRSVIVCYTRASAGC